MSTSLVSLMPNKARLAHVRSTRSFFLPNTRGSGETKYYAFQKEFIRAALPAMSHTLVYYTIAHV